MIKKLLCLFLCCMAVSVMGMVYTYSISEDLHDNIVRLHILANSDSEYDQKIKYEIRDAFVKKSDELKKNNFSDELMLDTAKYVLEKHNISYGVSCCRGDFYFPEKQYANITLPEGIYNGVKIILGNGEGQNWWCVLSPPMCFTKNAVGEADGSSLSKRLHGDTIDVITDRNGINYKFKIVEVIKKFIK